MVIVSISSCTFGWNGPIRTIDFLLIAEPSQQAMRPKKLEQQP